MHSPPSTFCFSVCLCGCWYVCIHTYPRSRTLALTHALITCALSPTQVSPLFHSHTHHHQASPPLPRLLKPPWPLLLGKQGLQQVVRDAWAHWTPCSALARLAEKRVKIGRCVANRRDVNLQNTHTRARARAKEMNEKCT